MELETVEKVPSQFEIDAPKEVIKPQPPRYFITANELADAFGITSQASQMWMKHNKIETFKFMNRSALTPENARRFLEKRGVTIKKEDLALMALKGGSGKTATAFNLGVRLNQYGAKILAVDLDMQGNMTDAYGIDMEDHEQVFYDVLDGNCKIESLIRNINPGLDLIPSSFNNSALDYYMVTNPSDLKTLLKKALAPIRDQYDYVVFDCSPSLNILNSCVALTASRVIIPVNPDKFSRKGLTRTIKEFQRLERDWDAKINYELVFSFYDARESSSQRYLIDYGIEHRDRLFSTLIRRNAEVKNTIDRKQCIFDVRNATAREDFDQLAREVLGIKALSETLTN